MMQASGTRARGLPVSLRVGEDGEHDDLRHVDEDDDAEDVDEARDEGRGARGGVETDAFEDDREHRALRLLPEGGDEAASSRERQC